MATGEIVSIVTEKGFGFLKPSTGGPDIFFHTSVVQGSFDGLGVGQPVEFELDDASEKPRARKVVAAGPIPEGARASGKRERGDKRPFRSAPPRSRAAGERSDRGPSRKNFDYLDPDIRFEFGFITKLHVHEQKGFISATSVGAELHFLAAEVSGKKSFSRFRIGDYVRFVRSKETLPPEMPGHPQIPIAENVQVAERRPHKPGPELPSNPRARRKKPTWR